MTKLSPTTVYVPVQVKNEMPVDNGRYFVETSRQFVPSNSESKQVCAFVKNEFYLENHHHSNDLFYCKPDTWLKEQQLYIFTREQIEKLLTDCWCKAIDHLDDIQNRQDYSATRKKYIQSLF